MLKRSLLIIVVLFLSISSVSAQGSSTGEARSYTSRHTVGISDPNAPVIFKDITLQTALKNYVQESGDRAKNFLVEGTSGSVAVLDYDNDGKPDIFLLNGCTIKALEGKEAPPKSALYRNLGNWQFEDVTNKAGVANERWGMGVAVGDFNNDGFPDMFVSNFGISRLYKNNGDGTFTDIAERFGVAINGWNTGATFGDYDRDGRLDLFVPGYLELDISKLPLSPADYSKEGFTARNFCQFRGEPVMCGPRGLIGAKDHLFHQKPDGTFEDVSVKAGVSDESRYYGFSSVFVDIDDDGWLDLLVVNDSTPKQLYHNKHDGTFEEIGYPSGIALNETGREQAGMGLAVGDYDNDGRVDFQITNFSDDSNTLYHNDGDENFTDVTLQADIGENTIPFLGWGTAFFDYDNDGWKDIIIANGHIYPQVDNFQWGTSYAQQMLLFHNIRMDKAKKGVKFERIGAAPNSGLAMAIKGRGLAVADLNGDGKQDVVINNLDAIPTVLNNVASGNNHWLKLKLIGDPSKQTPKDAVGSKVFVTIDGVRQRFDVISGASYASQNDQTISIGLGTAAKIDKLEIHWSGGQTEIIAVNAADQTFRIEQGKGIL